MSNAMLVYYVPHIAFGLCFVFLGLLLAVHSDTVRRGISLAFGISLMVCMAGIAFWSWFLRDGLGPRGRNRAGMESWARVLEQTWDAWAVLAFVGILGHLANRRAREYISLRLKSRQVP